MAPVKHAHKALMGVLLTILLAACGGDSGSMDAAAVGGDVDEHGCRASAGYAWCEYTQQCERPWELAEAQGFDNTPAAFASFCADGPPEEEPFDNPLQPGPSVGPDGG